MATKELSAGQDGSLVITTTPDPVVESVPLEVLVYRRSDLVEKQVALAAQAAAVTAAIAEIDDQLATAKGLGLAATTDAVSEAFAGLEAKLP